MTVARAAHEPAFQLAKQLYWDELLLWWAEIREMTNEATPPE